MAGKLKAQFWGYNPPFLGGPQNILSRQEDDRLIKNDILQLLLTVPGERVMRPDFGVPLRNFVFEHSIGSDLEILGADIVEALTRQEPRVTVDEVTVIPDDNRNGLQVRVVVRLKKDPTKELTIEQFIAGRF
jgi:phage baseplate assembly protein W